MKLLLICIVACLASGADAAPKLTGQWKSNKELTIATFKTPDSVPDDVRDRFFNVFGRMIITYTDNEMVTNTPPFDEFDGMTSRFSYRVEIATKDTIILVSTDSDTGEIQRTTLHFESKDRYYIKFELPISSPLYGAREYFDRIGLPEE